MTVIWRVTSVYMTIHFSFLVNYDVIHLLLPTEQALGNVYTVRLGSLPTCITPMHRMIAWQYRLAHLPYHNLIIRFDKHINRCWVSDA